MIDKVIVRCPAKINSFLAVGPPDETGYHPIRTIFHAVSIFDTLTLARGDSDSFTSNVPLPEANTVTKALRYARELVGVPSLNIHLEKKIPSEAGLGGGSSDAAGLLRGVCALFPGYLKDHEVFDIARAVGADVPYFLVGGNAKAEGYGEKLTPLIDQSPMILAIAQPGETCSTADAYKKMDSAPRDFKEFPGAFSLYNDFERVMPCGSDDFIEVMLFRGAKKAGLTGSGSAVFGIYETEEAAERVVEELLRTGATWASTAKTLDRAESLLMTL